MESNRDPALPSWAMLQPLCRAAHGTEHWWPCKGNQQLQISCVTPKLLPPLAQAEITHPCDSSIQQAPPNLLRELPLGMLVHRTDTIAVLDQHAALSRSYAALEPVPPSDCRAFPAQAPSVRPGKRKRSQEDRAETQKSESGEAVHDQLASTLQTAVTHFQSWQKAADRPLPTGQHSESGSRQLALTEQAQAAADSLRALAAQAVAETSSLDCISLAALRIALKPCFSWLSGQQQAPSNLFDKLHSSPDHCEALALAHETPVVVPSKASFMLGDIKHLRKLVTGVLPSACCRAWQSSRCRATA